MKKLFSLLSLAMACVLSLGYVSCSEDDDVKKLPDPPKAKLAAQYQAYFKGSAINYFSKLTAYVKNPLSGQFEKCEYNKTDTCFNFIKKYENIPDTYTQDSLEMYTLFYLDSLPSIKTDLLYGYGASVFDLNSSFIISCTDNECRGIKPDSAFLGFMGIIAEELSLCRDSIPRGGILM